MMALHSEHSRSGYADEPWFVGRLRSLLPQPLKVAVCTWSPWQIFDKPSSKPDGQRLPLPPADYLGLHHLTQT